MKKILIAGTAGLANEVVSWVCNKFEVIGYTSPAESNENELGLPGKHFLESTVTPELTGTDLVLLATGTARIKEKLYGLYKNKGFRFPTIVHPSSVISSSVMLGEGVIVAPNCVISPNVKVGIVTYINFQCGIGHDSVIGDFVQINPGSQLGGFTNIGSRTLIGSSSTVLQGVKIGNDVMVASGSVVFAKAVDNSTIMGNPARRMRAFEKRTTVGQK
jgi:sugar O-acyltransferase (sialic acid O-acetyltransferase NeuD family)